MSLSATSVALLLTIASPAHGAEAGMADVRDEGVTTTTEVVPAGAEPAPHPEEAELYDRFFGEEEVKEAAKPEQESPVAKAATDLTVPWWLLPVGMLGVGVLLVMRNKASKTTAVRQSIRVMSRTHMGKEGSLAMIEVADGDQRTRRLLVGFGGGAPRLVADVSAWEVAVAAPSPVLADEPRSTVAMPVSEPVLATQSPVDGMGEVISTGFGRALQGATRYGTVSTLSSAAEAPTEPIELTPEQPSHADLVADVLALHDASALGAKEANTKPSYSRRTVVA